MCHSEPTLEDCTRKWLLDDEGRRVQAPCLKSIMEVSESERQQAGLFKQEGGIYTSAYVKGMKCYYLGGELPDDEVRRMRSIRRRVHSSLPLSQWGQDPKTNKLSIRTYALRPVPALEMCLMAEARDTSHAINAKRRFAVRLPLKSLSLSLSI